jgi:hypothetical protein
MDCRAILTVEHEQAVASYAAEKYVMGELPAAEREQFEDHFFGCIDCAGDVRDLMQVAANLKVVIAEQAEAAPAPARESRRTWMDPWRAFWTRPAYGAALACALLVLSGIGGYQAITLRKQMNPQVVAAFMLRPESRGEETLIDVTKLGAFLLLEADVPTATGDLNWEVRRSDSASSLMGGAAAVPAPGATFKLLVPASKLQPSQYVLAIRTGSVLGSPTEVRYRFTIGAH